ncbi:MFS transporter [Ensifer sp. MJa1]|uniref:MFS transporter n=1 Tax=Ensifer sp. MJa1 TaxID=2919888 RepID=UPI00300B6C23
MSRRRGSRSRSSTLILYALPAIPLAGLALPLFVIVPTFYSEVMGLPVAAVGGVLFAIRVLDAASDPIFGWLADRWHGVGGRRRGFFLASIPLTAGAAFMLFWPPQTVGLGYLLVWGGLLSLGFTWTSLPYTAWGAELSNDYTERTRIAAYREGATLIGTLSAISLPFTVGTAAANGVDGLAAVAVLVAALLPITGLMAFVFVPEPVNRSTREIGLVQSLVFMAKNRPFLRLIAAFLLNGFANAIPATLFLYFVSERLGAPDWRGPLLLLYFACAVLGVPLAVKTANRFSKHKAWSGAMLATCSIFAVSGFLGDGDLVAFGVICVCTGLLLGFDLVLPPSMQADVIDNDTVVSGSQRSGMYFAAWALATKLSLAAAVGVVFPLLSAFGFDPTEERPSADALKGLSMLYAWLPIVAKLAAIGFMWRFPIERPPQQGFLARI